MKIDRFQELNKPKIGVGDTQRVHFNEALFRETVNKQWSAICSVCKGELLAYNLESNENENEVLNRCRERLKGSANKETEFLPDKTKHS